MNELNEDQAALVGAQVLGNLGGRRPWLRRSRRWPRHTPRGCGNQPARSCRSGIGNRPDLTRDLWQEPRVAGRRYVSQSLVESNAQTWILDYLPIRRLALRFVQDDDELRSYEFRHDVTFGAAPSAIRSGDVSRASRLDLASRRFD